jgi:alpha-L-fucosidase
MLVERRHFLKVCGILGGASATGQIGCTSEHSFSNISSYLKGYEEAYKHNPRQAALQWFREARYGLFIHYGPNALLSTINGRTASNDWLQYREKLSVAEYEELAMQFKAEKFNADFITDLILEAGMRYVTLTTRHHDGFCLFDSQYSKFNSVRAIAGRDLVEELTVQCRQKGIGIFYYYSHGRDWRHPHAPDNAQWGGSARPLYDPPEPQYKYGAEHDLNQYLNFMKNQIEELLTNYGPVAGIWLDGIGVPRSRPEQVPLFRCQELYDHIHSLQPQVLVSYKQGLLGTEDFLAPERKWNEASAKPLEICDTLQPKQWFYNQAIDNKHKSADDVMAMLANAREKNANLLLNTGPLPDGSIHPEDVRTLKEVAKRLRHIQNMG